MTRRFVGRTLNPINADLDARITAIVDAAAAVAAASRLVGTTTLVDADAALTPGVHKQFQLASTQLTAQRTITLGAVTAADAGKFFHIARPAGGAFSYVVKKPDASTLVNIPASGWAVAIVDEAGTWRIARKGSIAFSSLIPSNGLQFWFEADYGIGDANNAPITAWQDRSINGLVLGPGTGMTSPTYRANGSGMGLPSVEFANAHGLMTPITAALSFTSFAVFIVAIRGNTDGDGNLYEMFTNTYICAGLRDRAFAIYTARDNPGFFQSGREKNNPATSWMPRNVRKLYRHEYQGTHASDRLFSNGVNQNLIDSVSAGFAQDPGLQPSGAGSLHLGYRDVGTPGLNLTGHILAAIGYSPYPIAQDVAAVEAYLGRWTLQ